MFYHASMSHVYFSQVSAQSEHFLEFSLSNPCAVRDQTTSNACYTITYVLSWLECHTYTFSQVSAQLGHFENFDFRTPL